METALETVLRALVGYWIVACAVAALVLVLIVALALAGVWEWKELGEAPDDETQL